jgi:carbon monoxide dehydrogenase subunit G
MAMELDNSFTVPVPPDVAWSVLLDVARIAPCMPGATVDEVDGDVVNGRIKVKVGPVSLTYKGTATFTERDESARTVSVEASGKETRGAGTASAVVTASLAAAEDDSTLVTMHTTMNVTGRPAQFGRGVMVEVGGKLVDKFAENLALQLTADGAAASAGAAATAAAAAAADGAASSDGSAASAGLTDEAAGSGTDTADSGTAASENGAADEDAASETAGVVTTPPAPAQEDSLNLVRLVGPAILKRVLPVAAAVAAVALIGRWIRRGLRRGKQ